MSEKSKKTIRNVALTMGLFAVIGLKSDVPINNQYVPNSIYKQFLSNPPLDQLLRKQNPNVNKLRKYIEPLPNPAPQPLRNHLIA